MLAFFRAFAKSWVAKIFLIVPLVFAFGMVFNVSDFLHPKISDAVVEAGPRSIGEAEFKQEFENYKRRLEQEQNGGVPIPVDLLVKQGLPMELADQLASQQAFGAWLTRLGFKPSDKLIEDQIKTNRAFFNPFTGKFDKTQYLTLLAQNNLTEERFLQGLTDDVATQHFAQGVFSGLHAPAAYVAVQASLNREKRDASWFIINDKMAGSPPKPTDQQLNAFISAHAMRIPEVRTMTALLFSPRTVMDQVKVDPDQVKKIYDAQKDALSQPETRTFVQVPAPDGPTAQTIAQAIRGGADPVAVAKAHNIKPIPYVEKPKSAVPDPALAAAAFSLKAGDTSAPVQGAFGWSVVKVTSITPGHERTFDEAKGDIEAKLKEKLAEAKVDDLVQRYQDLRDKNVSVEDAAKQLGMTPLHYPAITRTGTLANGQPIRMPNGQPFVFPKPVLDALYSLPKGGQSESPQETGGPNEYFAIRVDDVAPAHMFPINDQTRPQLAQAWTQEAQAKLLQAKADELVARLNKGETLAAVAASVGAKVETRSDFGRITLPRDRAAVMQALKQDPALAILAQPQIFASQAGKAISMNCSVNEPCWAIARIDAIHPPVSVVAANDVLQYQVVADRALAQGFLQTTQKFARDKLKAKVDKDRLLSAIGAQPEGTAAPAQGR